MLRIRNGAALKPQADRDEAQGDSSPAPSPGLQHRQEDARHPGPQGSAQDVPAVPHIDHGTMISTTTI